MASLSSLKPLELGELDKAKNRNMQVTGKPLEIAISDISENPDNPRTEFDDEYLAELAADIAANGVKSPVSIRANPEGATPWVLNYGSRRRRASILAGKETIPAFVDEQFTNYDAVAENEQRRGLTTMELALFIQKRLKAGDKQVEIAKKLHKDSKAITNHMALIDMPDAIAKAYRESRVTTARTIYDLVKLHEKHADAVTAWCKGNDAITRGTVQALAKVLKRPEEQPDLPLNDGAGKAGPNTPQTDSTPQKGKQAAKKSKPKDKPQPVASEVAKYGRMPAVLVIVGKRRAVIVLEQKPTERGRVWVRYLDDGSVTEVKAGQCKLSEVTDAAELERQAVEA